MSNARYARNVAPPAAPANAGAAAAPPVVVPPTSRIGMAYPQLTSFFVSRSAYMSSALAGLFYLSVGAFVLLLLLTFIHFTMFPIFSFSPDDGGYVPVPTASDKQTAFTNTLAVPDISANIVGIPPCEYTVGFDLYLSGDFQSTTSPRILLYRSAAGPVGMTLADISSNVLTRFPDTNFLVWLDPIKNDLYVSAVTNVDATTTKRMETIGPVENVPLRKVNRVTVVFTQVFVEIYINGELSVSRPLRAKPIEQSKASSFFTAPACFSSNLMLANLTFWPRALSAREVRNNGEPIGALTLFTKPAS